MRRVGHRAGWACREHGVSSMGDVFKNYAVTLNPSMTASPDGSSILRTDAFIQRLHENKALEGQIGEVRRSNGPVFFLEATYAAALIIETMPEVCSVLTQGQRVGQGKVGGAPRGR
jgi:hypothetical protein